MEFTDVNYIAVVIAAIAAFAVGALWYSPALFGDMWMKLSKIKKSDINKAMKKGMAKSYGLGLLAQIVKAYVLSAMMLNFAMADLNGGLTLAFWIWLGFFATTMLGSVLWDMKPFKLYVLNTAHELAGLLVMGAVLGLIG